MNKHHGKTHNFKNVVRQLKNNTQIVFAPEHSYLFIFPNSVIGNKTWGKIDFLRGRINFDIVRINNRSDVDDLLQKRPTKVIENAN